MKTPITAADLLNNRVLPFYEQEDLDILRVLTDRGTEFYGNAESHEYEYNYERTHQEKMCNGRTPVQTLKESKYLWDEKVRQINKRTDN